MTLKKGAEEYRQLADKCRETARIISAENERADLLASAEIWDLIADRLSLDTASNHRPRQQARREYEQVGDPDFRAA
jgi:hypothetical protein